MVRTLTLPLDFLARNADTGPMNNAEVLLSRTNTFNGYGRLRPFSWTYEATVAGKRYTNSSLTEIKSVIKRKNPDLKITFVKDWEV